jgi:hypothetical protein
LDKEKQLLASTVRRRFFLIAINFGFKYTTEILQTDRKKGGGGRSKQNQSRMFLLACWGQLQKDIFLDW